MANSVLTNAGADRSRRKNRFSFSFAPGSSDQYTTGGFVIDLTAGVISPGAENPIPPFPPTVPQVNFEDTCAGYIGEWILGTTLKNGKIKFWASVGTELAAGNWPAAMQLDSINFVISKSRGLSQ